MMPNDPIEKFLQIGLGAEATQRASNPFRGFTLKRSTILFSSFTEGLRRIAALHDHYRKTGYAGALLVTAMPGSGKTTLLQYYADAFPAKEGEFATEIPVLFVSAPDQPTVKDLATKFLICLGDPFYDRGTAAAKKARVIKLLKQCGVQLILLDEFQHFYHGARKSESRKIPDWLKDILIETRIPMVVAGLPISVLVIQHAENIQLRRRFSSPFHIAPFSIDARKIEHLKELIGRIVELLPLPCEFSKEESFTRAVFYASNGSIDYIVRLFDGAVQFAGDARAKALNLVHFRKSFRDKIWADCPKFLNPFNPDAIHRSLDGFGEPFFGWTSPSDLRPDIKAEATAQESAK